MVPRPLATDTPTSVIVLIVVPIFDVLGLAFVACHLYGGVVSAVRDTGVVWVVLKSEVNIYICRWRNYRSLP